MCIMSIHATDALSVHPSHLHRSQTIPSHQTQFIPPSLSSIHISSRHASIHRTSYGTATSITVTYTEGEGTSEGILEYITGGTVGCVAHKEGVHVRVTCMRVDGQLFARWPCCDMSPYCMLCISMPSLFRDLLGSRFRL